MRIHAWAVLDTIPRWIPGIQLITTYRKDWLRPDLMAALTVFAVLIPQCMAYGSLARVAPVAGVYCALAALVAYAFFGRSAQLMVGPESGIAIMAAVLVAPLVTAASPSRYAAMMAMLALLVGAFLIAGGAGRAGFVADFLSKPILVGYMNGVALIVMASQLGKLFGISVASESFFSTIKDLITHLNETSGITLAIGLILIVFLAAMRRFFPKIPAALVAVVGTTAASAAFGLDQHGIAVVGPIPAGLPTPAIPAVGLRDVYDLLPAAASVALVAFADGILTARVFARKHRQQIAPNQEMIGLGASSVAAGLFQGFPTGASNSRSVVNDDSGGRTQMAGIIIAGLVAVFLLFFTPLLAQLPTVTLAAIVLVAAYGLLDIRGVTHLYSVMKAEAVLAVITFVAVLALGILYGILLAVALSLLTVIARISRPHSAILGPIPGVDGFQEIDPEKNSQTIPGLIAYRFDAPLFFANANHFLDEARELVTTGEPTLKWFLLDAEGIVNVDTTGIDALKELRTDLKQQGVVIAIARANRPVVTVFERSGFVAQEGIVEFYPTVRTAVEAYLFTQLGDGEDQAGRSQLVGEASGRMQRIEEEMQKLVALASDETEPPAPQKTD